MVFLVGVFGPDIYVTAKTSNTAVCLLCVQPPGGYTPVAVLDLQQKLQPSRCYGSRFALTRPPPPPPPRPRGGGFCSSAPPGGGAGCAKWDHARVWAFRPKRRGGVVLGWGWSYRRAVHPGVAAAVLETAVNACSYYHMAYGLVESTGILSRSLYR